MSLVSTLSSLLERVAVAVENASSLDRPADLGQKVTGKLPAGNVKDVLSGTPIGHPLHPVMVTVPIGAFAGAAVLDLTGADPAAARRLVGFGLLASVPTAAAGLSDWGDTLGAERRVGLAHAVLNTASLGLLAASWIARRDGGGRLLSTAGIGLLGASGWLGGHLSYADGVGVDNTAFSPPPVEWTDACAEDELVDGRPHAVLVAGMSVMLLRRGDRITAIANRCTHRGGPLSEGTVVGDCIQCPWHGSRFDVATGEVERGPSTRPQPALEVRLVAGQVQVQRSEARALRLAAG